MAPRSEDPKLIIRVINFELVQPICSRYVNVTDGRTDGQTDGRTDGRPTIAIPRFALRASRGNYVERQTSKSLGSCDYFSMSKMSAGRHLAYSETENVTIRSAIPENPTTELDIMSLSCVAPRELYHFKFLDKMAAGRHLGFGLRFCHSRNMTSRYVAGCPWPPAHQIW